MLLQKRTSNNPIFSDFLSKVGSDDVSAFGMGSVELSFLSGAKIVLSTMGPSLDADWLYDLVFAVLGWFVE